MRIFQTIGYFAAFALIGLTLSSFGPTLPDLAAQTQTNLSEISFLFTSRSFGYLLGSFGGGKLYDRMHGHPVLAAMLVIMAIMMALVPLIPLLWLLTIVIFILGAAEGVLDVGGNTLIVWIYGDKVGPYMYGLHFFFGAGAFLSPIIITVAISFGRGIILPYWALALLMLPVAIWLLFLPSPTVQTLRTESSTGQVSYQLVTLIALFLFLYVGAEVSFGGWIFTYTVSLNLSGATTASYLTSTFWGSLTLGRLLAIPLASRLRPRTILLGDLAGCLLSLAVLLLWSNSLTAILSGTIGLGFSMASIFPTLFSFAERRMTITGQVTGWFLVGASSGSMFLPWLIGQLFEQTGPRVMMLVIMSALILAVGILITLIRIPARPSRINSNSVASESSNCRERRLDDFQARDELEISDVVGDESQIVFEASGRDLRVREH